MLVMADLWAERSAGLCLSPSPSPSLVYPFALAASFTRALGDGRELGAAAERQGDPPPLVHVRVALVPPVDVLPARVAQRRRVEVLEGLSLGAIQGGKWGEGVEWVVWVLIWSSADEFNLGNRLEVSVWRC